MNGAQKPGIGVAVLIRKNGTVLLGIRTKKTGYGTRCPPGGGLEMNETLEQCAIREVREEASIEIENVRYKRFVEVMEPEHNSHFITFLFVADWKSGEPVPQPEEFSRFEWFDWDTLPEPRLFAFKLLVDAGINPFAD